MLIIDSDMPIEIIDFLKEQVSEVMVAEIVKGKPYSCPALKPSKGKEVVCLENKEEFSFDISKANQIFDYLLKDQQIKLSHGHRILSLEQLKNKRYCKWHNSFSHATINCVVFRNAIQKVIKEGRFKLVK